MCKERDDCRLFVSIPIERHFARVFSRYRDAHDKIPYLRWTPERKLHLTVLFLGSVHRSLVAQLITALHDSIGVLQLFSLAFDKVSYAPPGRPADMVWAYFKEDVALNKLLRVVRAASLDVSITPADSCRGGGEITLPHVTLARFRGRPYGSLATLHRAGLEGNDMLVDQVLLTESRTTEGEAVYETLESYALHT